MKPSDDNIALGRALAPILGIEPHVYPYFDEDESHQVHILDVIDRMDPSVKIYATIGV